MRSEQIGDRTSNHRCARRRYSALKQTTYDHSRDRFCQGNRKEEDEEAKTRCLPYQHVEVESKIKNYEIYRRELPSRRTRYTVRLPNSSLALERTNDASANPNVNVDSPADAASSEECRSRFIEGYPAE